MYSTSPRGFCGTWGVAIYCRQECRVQTYIRGNAKCKDIWNTKNRLAVTQFYLAQTPFGVDAKYTASTEYNLEPVFYAAKECTNFRKTLVFSTTHIFFAYDREKLCQLTRVHYTVYISRNMLRHLTFAVVSLGEVYIGRQTGV